MTARRAGLLALAGLLAACGGPTLTFSKPGASEAQRKADQTACLERSIGAGEPAKPAAVPDVDRDALVRCMEAKGYAVRGP
jgi:hypothetical protein